MVAFGFLYQNFGGWWEPMNDTLSFYECRVSSGDTMRWWVTKTLPYAKEFV